MSGARAANVDTFRKRFGGTVLEPDDAGYDKARAIWNGAIDRRPAVIAQCANPAEVADAIHFGRDAGLEISVRGGGHNFSGNALVNRGLTVDLTRMRQVTVDPKAKRSRCGGGATWGDYDTATYAHGLASTGGFITHTGVAGLTLGGGLGWLNRKAGLASDNLTAVELVTAAGDLVRASATAGDLVRASATENPDLFWAVRGGGGNFGVVTTFEFALHEVGPVYLQLYFWGLDDGPKVLRAFEDFTRGLPDDVTAFMDGHPPHHAPDEYRQIPGYTMVVVGFSTPEAHRTALAPVRDAFPTPLFESATTLKYTELQSMADVAAPWGILAYERAIHLETMSPEAADVIAEHLPRKASPMSFMPIFVLGGAYSRIPDGDSAFSGSRSTRYVVNMAALAQTHDLLAADTQWVRNLWDALVPHSGSVGSYVNFMTEFEHDRVRASYGPKKYDRLASIKATWDPDNVFHLNANIQPAGKLAGKLPGAAA